MLDGRLCLAMHWAQFVNAGGSQISNPKQHLRFNHTEKCGGYWGQWRRTRFNRFFLIPYFAYMRKVRSTSSYSIHLQYLLNVAIWVDDSMTEHLAITSLDCMRCKEAEICTGSSNCLNFVQSQSTVDAMFPLVRTSSFFLHVDIYWCACRLKYEIYVWSNWNVLYCLYWREVYSECPDGFLENGSGWNF